MSADIECDEVVAFVQRRIVELGMSVEQRIDERSISCRRDGQRTTEKDRWGTGEYRSPRDRERRETSETDEIRISLFPFGIAAR